MPMELVITELVIPAYDDDNPNIKRLWEQHIWKHLSYHMTSEDFEALQRSLNECEDDLRDIEESKLLFIEFETYPGHYFIRRIHER